MRTLLGMLMVVLLALAGCGSADRPRAESGAVATDAPAVAPAQPGGTIEAGVKYTGEAVTESVTINKDVEQCGTTKRTVITFLNLGCALLIGGSRLPGGRLGRLRAHSGGPGPSLTAVPTHPAAS